MLQPLNKYRYRLTSQMGTDYVTPLGESNLHINYDRANNIAGYRRNLTGKLVFIDANFSKLLRLEQSIYRRCTLTLTIEQECNGVWNDLIAATLSFNKGDWDLDRCTFTVEPNDDQAYECLDILGDTEWNMFEVVKRITVGMLPLNVTVETVKCTGDCGGDYSTVCQSDKIGFILYKKVTIQHIDPNPDFTYCHVEADWARETTTVPTGTQMDSSWTLISSSGGSSKYGRPANVYNCITTNTQNDLGGGVFHNTYVYTCAVRGIDGSGGGDVGATQITNGVRLSDLLIYVVGKVCPDLTVKSDFFQINPVNPTDTNYVTGRQSTTAHIVVYQKSDVKRPNDPNRATVGMVSLNDLIDWISQMFNCQFEIKNGIMRVEHISWFARTAGFDLTSAPYQKYLRGTSVYQYDNTQIPIQETYSFKETDLDISHKDFAGVPITYDTACKNDSGGVRSTIDHPVSMVVTDVEFCLSNPDSGNSLVTDDGFVFVSTLYDSGQDKYSIQSEASGILGESLLNNVFGWAFLHRDFHKYDRPVSEGYMNNQLTQFQLIKRTKKQSKITIPLCCDDLFDPDQTIKTYLGDGFIDSATFDLSQQTLSVMLSYDPTADLYTNQPPVAGDDTFTVYTNSTNNVLNVTANDYDPEGYWHEAPFVVIDVPPAHGTVTVMDNGNVVYTPNIGYEGADSFKYHVVDDWNVSSNQATVNITVQLHTANIAFWLLTASTPIANYAASLTLNHPVSLFIDWGDGVHDHITDRNASAANHTYVTKGTYTISIQGTVMFDDGFVKPTPLGTTLIATSAINAEFNNLDNAFVATGLTNLPVGIFDNMPNLQSVLNVFQNCVSLAGSIPATLFANNTLLTQASGAFYHDTLLTGSIPATIFANNYQLTAVESFFNGCTGLTGSIPQTLLYNNPKLLDVAGLFSGCTGLTGSIPLAFLKNNPVLNQANNLFASCTGLTGSIPADLFSYSNSITTVGICFQLCSGLTGTIPPNLLTNQGGNLQNAHFLFDGCTGLTGSIPNILFQSNSGLTNVQTAFRNCSNLTGNIPPDLFINNSKVVNMTAEFNNCSKLSGSIPETLFSNCNQITTFQSCFSGCTLLSGAIPQNLFQQNSLATSFSSTFLNCSNLTAIPAGLFNSCRNTTSFANCFQNCSAITSGIPTGLFTGMSAVTSYAACFSGCTNLSGSIPANLFTDSTQVTTFQNTFTNCANLTGAVGNIFNSTAVITASGLFQGCSKITSLAAGIFDKFTQCTTFQSVCFTCTALTTIPTQLFKNCSKVTNYVSAFQSCPNITGTLDVNFFNLTAPVTTFSNCFNGDSKLTGTAPALWTTYPSATSSACFRTCTLLTNYASIPSAWK